MSGSESAGYVSGSSAVGPPLPSPRLMPAGCTCYLNLVSTQGKYVPKRCSLHSPLEFDEHRPSIQEVIKEVKAFDVNDVDDLTPLGVDPVTIPYDLAEEMAQQFTLLLDRVGVDNISQDDCAEILVRRATLYSGMKDHDRAYNDCKKAIELRSDYTPAMFRGGHAAFRKGDFVQAIRMFQRGLKLSPNNSALQKAYRCAVITGIKSLKQSTAVGWRENNIEGLIENLIENTQNNLPSFDPEKNIYSAPPAIPPTSPNAKSDAFQVAPEEPSN